MQVYPSKDEVAICRDDVAAAMEGIVLSFQWDDDCGGIGGATDMEVTEAEWA